MPVQKLAIEEFLRRAQSRVVLDVRSPGEFHHAHIPGAHSFPLFTDEERKIVGTTYKQQSREQAIKVGLDLFGPKMRGMVEEAEQLIAQTASREVFVHCWRGGMRSAAIAWLLDLYGFKVYTLSGGYKAFRNFVLQTFTQPFQLNILGGYTGSGKTDVLQQMQASGHTIIDLEKIAAHKGSAFGSYRMPPQPKQEMFENLLALELREKAGAPIWMEDESQRIGDLNLPNALWDSMRNAPLVFMDIPFEERLQYIVREYGDCPVEKLMGSVTRISKRLGPLETKNTLAFLEEGNTAEAFRILLHYYDKRYLKALHNREALPALLKKIHCTTVRSGNAALIVKHQSV